MEQNPIMQYADAIKSGAVTVGRWIAMLYTRLADGLQNGVYRYDAAKADAAIDWIEEHCFHVEGPLAPGRLRLKLWQRALIAAIFGIVDADGKRQFREVLLVIARKNGKSILASAIANYVFRVDGGYGAKVYTLAPKLAQAEIIYANTWQMIQLDPEQQAINDGIAAERAVTHSKVKDDIKRIRRRVSDIYLPALNASMAKISSSAKKSDGFNPSLCICDEIASWEGEKGLRAYEVMKSGMGARLEPLLISCTTSGYVNDSIYDELVKRGTRFLLGDSAETRLLPVLYMIDDISLWNDPQEWRKANPNLGTSITESYLREELAIACGSLSKKAEFITKYCNLKQNASTAWLSADVIENACGEHFGPEDFRDSYCVCGIDLSQTRDLTAVTAIIEKCGELYALAHFFMPAERIDEATARDNLPYNIYRERGLLTLSGENIVDYRDCFNWIAALVNDYQILPLMIGYDRYSAQYLINDLEAAGFRTDDIFQGENLYPVIQETQGLLEDKRLHIGDNDLLKVHLLNSAIKMSVERGRGKLVKLSQNAHIDGAAALLDAMTVRQKWNNEIGPQLENKHLGA